MKNKRNINSNFKHLNDTFYSLVLQCHHGFAPQPSSRFGPFSPARPLSYCHRPAACLHHHHCKRGVFSLPAAETKAILLGTHQLFSLSSSYKYKCYIFSGSSAQRCSGELSVTAEHSHDHSGQSQNRDPASDRHPDWEDAWRRRGSSGWSNSNYIWDRWKITFSKIPAKDTSII